MAAAVALVTERGTADLPVSDIAEAAEGDQLAGGRRYQQFRTARRCCSKPRSSAAAELLPRVTEAPPPGARDDRMRAIAEHMAARRPFYRALLTSPCAFALTKALNSLFLPLNREGVCRRTEIASTRARSTTLPRS